MSEYLHKKVIVFGADGAQGTALPTATTFDTGTEVKAVKLCVHPIDVYRWGIVCTTTFDAGSFAAQLRKTSPIGGSPAVMQTLLATVDRVAGDVDFVDSIIPVAQAAGDDTLAGGVTPQTSVLDVGPAGPVRFEAGDLLDINQSVASTAGDGYYWIEFVELPMNLAADNVHDIG